MEQINPIIFYTDLIKYNGFVPLIYEDIVHGMYLINKYGEIFSIQRNKILKQDTTHSGYKRICLITYSGKRNFSIHRLVAYTFIININKDLYTDANHIDGDKCNNSAYNLEWCSNNENKHHASINGLYQHGENRYNSIYTDNFIIEVCEKFQSGMSYNDVYRYYQELYPNTSSSIGSLIYKLYHRKTRNDITKLYNY